ncbi:hypothetical protein Dred_0492 [Desulforamulus reducens MI-1]|uniref:Uncharacterized protein n=1 Tax=Desulforamulus reducens (strain ATCC BAA-1160 / DSM 100696 / MI-1) TaxID=349161 RepID=A4J1T5_DESRM|nr:hypothetical protein [Desulforamulus reducens]ABO49038.1 hypothetical protein Dred_0492 [Desulforamulus reducens MI-1]
MFQEYRQIVYRIKGLDKPLSSLTRAERNDVLNLSIRQEEIEKHIGQQIQKSFKELQEGLEVVAEWVRLMKEDAIKALGIGGTPEEVLALEETLAQATSLNMQISGLTLANYSPPEKSEPEKHQQTEEPVKTPIKIIKAERPKHKPTLPVFDSTIDMVENNVDQKIVSKVIKEINESVTAAAPTAYLPEVFNQPRITSQKSRPAKRKKR